MLIGLVGIERCGKDTIADYLVSNYNFTKYNLADPIKKIAKIMFNWSHDQLYNDDKDKVDPNTQINPREFFNWFGTDIAQFHIYDKFPELGNEDSIGPRRLWSNAMQNYILEKQKLYGVDNTNIIIPDIRFIHEADDLRKLGGILIHIDNIDNPDLSKYDLCQLIYSEWIENAIENKDTLIQLYSNIDDIMIKEYHLTKKNKNTISVIPRDNYSIYL